MKDTNTSSVAGSFRLTQKREELFSGQVGNTELEFSAEIGHPCTQNKVAQYRSFPPVFRHF